MPSLDSLIMRRLKEETADLHHDAEHRPLQKAMAKGDIDRQRYAGYLSQLLLVHRFLEDRLTPAASSDPLIHALTDGRRHQDRIADDLRSHDIDPDRVTPATATAAMISDLDATADRDLRYLLGAFYVLEGSTNGNKFLARVLQQAFGLEDLTGLAYLNSYGDAQSDRWAAFKADAAASDWGRTDLDEIVAAAQRTFQGIAEISDEVWSA